MRSVRTDARDGSVAPCFPGGLDLAAVHAGRWKGLGDGVDGWGERIVIMGTFLTISGASHGLRCL